MECEIRTWPWLPCSFLLSSSQVAREGPGSVDPGAGIGVAERELKEKFQYLRKLRKKIQASDRVYGYQLMQLRWAIRDCSDAIVEYRNALVTAGVHRGGAGLRATD